MSAETTDSDQQPPPEGRRRLIERGPGFVGGVRELPRRMSFASAGSAVVSAVFGCTGPALIVINGAEANGLSPVETSSWIFAIYVFGGLVSLIMATYYRQPIVGSFSIPGAVLVVSVLGSYTMGEMVGAYIVASLLVFLLGVSGAVRRVMSWLPLPIIMAMIAGALMSFAIDVIDAAFEAPWIVIAALAGFLVSTRFLPRVPGVLAGLVCGAIAAATTGSIGGGESAVELTAPALITPSFDIGVIVAVAIPLAVLAMGAENAQAIGVLFTERYRPPMNAMTIICGVGGLLAAPFGGHNTNMAGPMTAICASPESGPHESRYTGAVLNGVLFGSFGALAGLAVGVITALPGELVAAVAGLAMITVLVTSLQGAFKGARFQIGAFFALVIALSDVTVFGISAPFWALLGGVLASLVLESSHFRARETRQPTE